MSKLQLDELSDQLITIADMLAATDQPPPSPHVLAATVILHAGIYPA
jgi:hypothetical protein